MDPDAGPQPLIVPDVKITTGARVYRLPDCWKTCVHMFCASLDTNFANSSASPFVVADPPVLWSPGAAPDDGGGTVSSIPPGDNGPPPSPPPRMFPPKSSASTTTMTRPSPPPPTPIGIGRPPPPSPPDDCPRRSSMSPWPGTFFQRTRGAYPGGACGKRYASPDSARGRRAHASVVAYQPSRGCSVTPPLEEWTNQPLPT